MSWIVIVLNTDTMIAQSEDIMSDDTDSVIKFMGDTLGTRDFKPLAIQSVGWHVYTGQFNSPPIVVAVKKQYP